jgi:hypothetical protein
VGNHVFICYARDDLEFVLKLAANLKARGVTVWLDQDLPPGANWPRYGSSLIGASWLKQRTENRSRRVKRP